MFNSRLILDCAKSPKIASIHIETHNIKQKTNEKSVLNEIKIEYSIEKNNEPTAPSIDLFGDTDSNNLFFPKLTPTIYPTVSTPQIKIR